MQNLVTKLHHYITLHKKCPESTLSQQQESAPIFTVTLQDRKSLALLRPYRVNFSFIQNVRIIRSVLIKVKLQWLLQNVECHIDIIHYSS